MLKALRYAPSTAIVVLAVALFAGTHASASVLAVGPDIFAGSPVLGFTNVRTGTEVNGLVVRGITFNYLLGGVPTNRQLVIDGGPGNTNNITEPNIVSSGDNSGMLTLALPAPVTAIGYGYAILSGDNLPTLQPYRSLTIPPRSDRSLTRPPAIRTSPEALPESLAQFLLTAWCSRSIR